MRPVNSTEVGENRSGREVNSRSDQFSVALVVCTAIFAQWISFHSFTSDVIVESNGHPFRQEASSMYYRSNDFELNLHLTEMGNAVQWLQSIIKLCGCDPFGQFSFYLLSAAGKTCIA